MDVPSPFITKRMFDHFTAKAVVALKNIERFDKAIMDGNFAPVNKHFMVAKIAYEAEQLHLDIDVEKETSQACVSFGTHADMVLNALKAQCPEICNDATYYVRLVPGLFTVMASRGQVMRSDAQEMRNLYNTVTQALRDACNKEQHEGKRKTLKFIHDEWKKLEIFPEKGTFYSHQTFHYATVYEADGCGWFSKKRVYQPRLAEGVAVNPQPKETNHD